MANKRIQDNRKTKDWYQPIKNGLAKDPTVVHAAVILADQENPISSDFTTIRRAVAHGMIDAWEYLDANGKETDGVRDFLPGYTAKTLETLLDLPAGFCAAIASAPDAWILLDDDGIRFPGRAKWKKAADNADAADAKRNQRSNAAKAKALEDELAKLKAQLEEAEQRHERQLEAVKIHAREQAEARQAEAVPASVRSMSGQCPVNVPSPSFEKKKEIANNNPVCGINAVMEGEGTHTEDCEAREFKEAWEAGENLAPFRWNASRRREVGALFGSFGAAEVRAAVGRLIESGHVGPQRQPCDIDWFVREGCERYLKPAMQGATSNGDCYGTYAKIEY